MTNNLKDLYKYLLLLLFLDIVLLGAGFLLISTGIISVPFIKVVTLTVVFLVIISISLIIFFRGQSKNSSGQVVHTLVSVSLKFLLELVLALVWFLDVKKALLSSLIIFFVLYLSLTLFLIWVILKTLKTKSLKN